VIVSFSGHGNSYDALFTSVPQLAPQGRVAVYAATPDTIPLILSHLNGRGEPVNEIAQEISENIARLAANAVVFNFECCGDFSSETFGGNRVPTMDIIQHALKKGHMVMFSDFALKALIRDWSEPHLGPNPFVKVGEFGSSFELRFKPKDLLECASAQLTKVGQLCENGEATVHALGGTIAYDLRAGARDTAAYQLEVLTVATRLGSMTLPAERRSQIGDHTGIAGHVILKYPSGGNLLVSCGHWIELARLDVSAESVLKVAESTWGSDYSAQISEEIKSAASPAARDQVVQKWAGQMVQQSAPCQYSYT